jgi:hypothetical protein
VRCIRLEVLDPCSLHLSSLFSPSEQSKNSGGERKLKHCPHTPLKRQSVPWSGCILVLISLCMAGSRATAGAKAQDTKMQPLTVTDSIEMTHFMDPSEYSVNPHPKFSPDGQQFLIVTERGRLEPNLREYSLLVYNVRDLGSKPARIVTFNSSSNRDGISDARWLNNETILFAAENPDERPQVYAVNVRSGNLRKLTSEHLGVAGPFDISADLTLIVYSVPWSGDEELNRYKELHGFAVTTERLFDLASGEWGHPSNVYETYVMNISTGKRQAVKMGPTGGRAPNLRVWVSPHGEYAILERPAFPVPPYWQFYADRAVSEEARSRQHSVSRLEFSALDQAGLLDLQTGEYTPLVDAPISSMDLSVLWSSDRESVIICGTYLPLDEKLPLDELEKRKAEPALVEFNIPNRTFQVIRYIPKGETWRLEPNTSTDIIYLRVQRALPAGFPASKSILKYRRDGDKWVEQQDFLNGEVAGKTGEREITITHALDQWPRLTAVDHAANQEIVIYDPNPQFRARRFGRVKTIHWKNKSGEQWIGGLVFPVNYREGTRYPLVIQTHGFDPDAFLLDGSFTTAMAAQELASKDIAVLQIGNGPNYSEVHGTPAEGQEQLSGVESSIDYLDGLGLIDRTRVGLVGFSRTAYHTKYALTHSKYQFAAATIAEGIDFGYWMYIMDPYTAGWRRQFEKMWGGPPWRDNWKSWVNSVSFNFDEIRTPVRIECDTNPGSVIQEWETFAALRLLNKPVELIFIPHGFHPILKPWERITSQEGNVDWMTFWLKNEEDSDPKKVVQYARWRLLRKLQSGRDQEQKSGGL